MENGLSWIEIKINLRLKRNYSKIQSMHIFSIIINSLMLQMQTWMRGDHFIGKWNISQLNRRFHLWRKARNVEKLKRIIRLPFRLWKFIRKWLYIIRVGKAFYIDD